jgi:hypothetical protein
MREYKERISSAFEGTIIDIETIGGFCSFPDSRKCCRITPVIFGCIGRGGISIYCAKSMESIGALKERVPAILKGLERPFHAFNCSFEMSVFFHSLGIKVPFERELNAERYEAKRNAVLSLGIPQYSDPFGDNGKLCMESWLKGDIERAIAHNRSCLLKERDILLKRGFRKPDALEFVEL